MLSPRASVKDESPPKAVLLVLVLLPLLVAYPVTVINQVISEETSQKFAEAKHNSSITLPEDLI